MSTVDQKAQDQREEENFIKNYSRIANMLVDGYPDLLPQEKWLYVCLVRLCGKEGTRFLSLRYIAERTGFSIGALSASKKTGSPGMLKRLHEAGIIHAEIKKRLNSKGHETQNAQFHVTITDIWQKNYEFFYGSTCSEVEHLEGESESPVRKSNATCSKVERVTPQPVRKSNATCSTFSTNVILHSNTTEDTKITEDKNTHVAAIAEHDTFLAPLLALLEKFRNGDAEEQASTLQVLQDAGFLENHSSTTTNQLPTHVEKLETNSQPANSTTLSEASITPSQNVENAPVPVESNNSTPTTEIASEVAKSQASDDKASIRIAATTTKPARNTRKPKKNALELVPVLPPARPLAETPWGVEKCLAWGDYVRKSTLPESVRKDSKSFKAKEAACKIIGRGITENSFLVIFVNWMKGIDLDLNPLANGELKSETWPNYSVDLWVVDEHYEDEARKYQKAKLAQGSVSTHRNREVTPPYLRRYDPSKDEGARIVNIGPVTKSTVPASVILRREIARQQAEAAAKEAENIAQQA